MKLQTVLQEELYSAMNIYIHIRGFELVLGSQAWTEN